MTTTYTTAHFTSSRENSPDKTMDSISGDSIGLKVCRICLASDGKMFPMKNQNLERAYENLTGILLDKDTIPQSLCNECSQRLLNSDSFRSKCIKTNLLLNQLAEANNHLTQHSIQSISREAQHLRPLLSLSPTRTEPDFHFSEQENIVPVVEIICKPEIPYEFPPIRVEIKQEVEDDRTMGPEGSENILTNERLSQNFVPEVPPFEFITLVKPEPLNSDEEREGVGTSESPDTTRLRDDPEKASGSGLSEASAWHQPSHYTSQAGESSTNVSDDNIDYETNKKKKTYPCNVCGKVLARKQSLDAHVRIHTGEKPYPCNICQKRFSKKCSLHKHSKIHTGEKPYACDECDSAFKVKQHLDRHKKIHNNTTVKLEKRYSCDVCGNKFTQMFHLNQHMRIHTGDKRYACDVCEKKFVHKCNWVSHMKLHSGEKPFSCDICQRKFSVKTNLERHKKIHTGENVKQFTCEVCRKRFVYKFNLVSHLKRKHMNKQILEVAASLAKSKAKLVNLDK